MFLIAVFIIVGLQIGLNHQANLKLENMQNRIKRMQQMLNENKGDNK